MEKDYFDDRSYQAIHNCLLEPGDVCYVCEKHMQKEINSSDISKLTKGIIVRKLTSVKKHPRGVKYVERIIHKYYLYMKLLIYR